jgi:arylsulfatase A-like enzyme
MLGNLSRRTIAVTSFIGGSVVAGLLVFILQPQASPANRPSSARRVASAAASNSRPAVTPAAAVPVPRPRCPDRPNVLLVVIDTLRYDASQLSPNSENATPFLASLRARGVHFTNSYSTGDETLLTHFSLLTGYVDGLGTLIDVPEASIAHQLNRAGYRTWGVAANPNLSHTSYRPVQRFGTYTCLGDEYAARPKEEIDRELPALDARIRAYSNRDPDETQRLLVWPSGERVLRRVERRLHASDRPFFGFVNFMDVHDPYLPDPKRYAREKEKATIEPLRSRTLPAELRNPEQIEDEKRRASVVAKIAQAGGRAWSVAFDLTPAQIATYHRRYLAEVRDLEGSMRRLFEFLEERRLLESTIVIVTSDHGEAFGEAGLMSHAFGNTGDREAVNRVPLLILFPPCYEVTPGESSVPVSSADVAATIYDVAKIDTAGLARKALPGHFGRSLLTYVRKESAEAESRTPADDRWARPAAETRKRESDEALRKLRSLGYLQ